MIKLLDKAKQFNIWKAYDFPVKIWGIIFANHSVNITLRLIDSSCYVRFSKICTYYIVYGLPLASEETYSKTKKKKDFIK